MNLTAIAGTVAAAMSALVLYLAYRKGRKDEQQGALARSAEHLAEVHRRDEEREKNHVQRVENIACGDLSPNDVSRMLSEYPAENTYTQAARKKTG